jgi:hypothetical protein
MQCVSVTPSALRAGAICRQQGFRPLAARPVVKVRGRRWGPDRPHRGCRDSRSPASLRREAHHRPSAPLAQSAGRGGPQVQLPAGPAPGAASGGRQGPAAVCSGRSSSGGGGCPRPSGEVSGAASRQGLPAVPAGWAAATNRDGARRWRGGVLSGGSTVSRALAMAGRRRRGGSGARALLAVRSSHQLLE